MAEKNGCEIDKLFRAMIKNKASDLFLKIGCPPLMRIGGIVQPTKLPPLNNAQIERLTKEMMDERTLGLLETQGAADFSHSFDERERMRVNVYKQRGFLGMAARLVQSRIPTIQELNVPEQVLKLAEFHQGLILICGVTGSGKSTTLAAMIQHINQTRRCHIITVEDPVEYQFDDAKSFVDQREIGIDTPDWETALKHVVRQNPDVILVGEMRDPVTFSAGLTMAETGHLVFGTLHSSTVSQTFARIYDLFPPDKRSLVRQTLCSNLRGIVCQILVPSAIEDVSVVPAIEVMFNNPTMQKLIHEQEEHKITDALRAFEQDGMMDFTMSFTKLVQEDKVLRKVALQYVPNREQLDMALRGIIGGTGGIIG